MFQRIKNYFKNKKTTTNYRDASSSSYIDTYDTASNMTLMNSQLHSVDIDYTLSKSCCSDAIAESISSDGGDCGGGSDGGGH